MCDRTHVFAEVTPLTSSKNVNQGYFAEKIAKNCHVAISLYGTSLEVKTLSIVLYFLMSIFRSWDLEHDFLNNIISIIKFIRLVKIMD